MSIYDQASKWARRQLAPMTVGLMASFVMLSVLFWFTNFKFMDALELRSDWTSRPWTILTYPFAYMFLGNVNRIIWLIILLSWMSLTCGSVERTIGTVKYGILWLVLTVVPGLLYITGGGLISGGRAELLISGPFFPVAGISFIWALTHKDFAVSVFFAPITGFWIAWIIVAGVIFGYGMGAPILGFIAALYLIPCWFWAENKIPGFPYELKGYQYRPSKQQREKDESYFADVAKRRQERAERERLRKLFESSLDDDKK